MTMALQIIISVNIKLIRLLNIIGDISYCMKDILYFGKVYLLFKSRILLLLMLVLSIQTPFLKALKPTISPLI